MNRRDIAVGLSILAVILVSGCAKKITEFKSYNEVQNNNKVENLRFKKVNRRVSSLPTSNKACIGDDCIATISKKDRGSNPVKPFSILAKAKTDKKNIYTPIIESVYSGKVVEPISSSDSYNSNYITSAVEIFPKIDTNSQKISVQVGAFRKYSGAKVYKRRYSMLNSQYQTVIKNGQKDTKPIYRVQIEGFQNELEAVRFISEHKHSLGGAFLVRR